jgi:hypothetical protein
VTAGPVLLLVVYVETRGGLGSLLRAVVVDHGPVRVLLLARSLGEWWDRLVEESPAAIGQLLISGSPLNLETRNGCAGPGPDGRCGAVFRPRWTSIRRWMSASNSQPGECRCWCVHR